MPQRYIYTCTDLCFDSDSEMTHFGFRMRQLFSRKLITACTHTVSLRSMCKITAKYSLQF